MIRSVSLLLATLALCWASAASASCTIHVTIAQTGAHPVAFINGNAVVRSRAYDVSGAFGSVLGNPWGTWREMWRDSFLDRWAPTHVHRLARGQSVAGHYFGTLGCGLDREFRVTYQCTGGIYAATNYTFARTVALAGAQTSGIRRITVSIGSACR